MNCSRSSMAPVIELVCFIFKRWWKVTRWKLLWHNKLNTVLYAPQVRLHWLGWQCLGIHKETNICHRCDNPDIVLFQKISIPLATEGCFGSCVLQASGLVVDTQSTLQMILDWHLIDSLIDILSTIDQQLVNSQPSVNQLTCIDRKSVDSRLTVDQDVNEVSVECQPRCWSNVNWCVDGVLIEYQSSVDQGWVKGIDWGYQLILNRGCL